MKNEIFNPYLPPYEYIPDGEPYVFNDRLYIYGSHDMFDGPEYCHLDYVCWSAPIDDLSDWHYEGVIYSKTADPKNNDGTHCMYAPDVTQGKDGKYYLYYGLDRVGTMSVAVCDTPAGKYKFLGHVKRKDGTIIGEANEFYQFDPGIFIDDDGRIFLYTGFAVRTDTNINASNTGGRDISVFDSFYMELEDDMLTAKHEPRTLIPIVGKSQGTGFEGHEFFEASSMRKINGKYYFVYSSINSHELCYAISDKPDGGFKYGGTLVSIGDVYLNNRTIKDAVNYIGNTHGGMAQLNGEWYIFYHRQTNLHQYSRQACAEKITIAPDGSIAQAEITSCGLNPTPLIPNGTYPAHIACNLIGPSGCDFYSFNERTPMGDKPYFTQDAPDCDPSDIVNMRQRAPRQYIANITNGTIIGFKYFQFTGEPLEIELRTSGAAQGIFEISTTLNAPPIAEIPINITPRSSEEDAPFDTVQFPKGKHGIFIKYKGEGALNLHSFSLSIAE